MCEGLRGRLKCRKKGCGVSLKGDGNFERRGKGDGGEGAERSREWNESGKVNHVHGCAEDVDEVLVDDGGGGGQEEVGDCEVEDGEGADDGRGGDEGHRCDWGWRDGVGDRERKRLSK